MGQLKHEHHERILEQNPPDNPAAEDYYAELRRQKAGKRGQLIMHLRTKFGETHGQWVEEYIEEVDAQDEWLCYPSLGALETDFLKSVEALTEP